MKHVGWLILLFILTLIMATQAFARSDFLIRMEIEARITGTEKLRGVQINISVKERLVVLAGEVRFYEQKLISDRIAWETLGVFEVDNNIRVVPKHPKSDIAIKQQIWELVKTNERFLSAVVSINSDNGVVFIKGNFLDFRDPSKLKNRVAKIEGVVALQISATFITLASETYTPYHILAADIRVNSLARYRTPNSAVCDSDASLSAYKEEDVDLVQLRWNCGRDTVK